MTFFRITFLSSTTSIVFALLLLACGCSSPPDHAIPQPLHRLIDLHQENPDWSWNSGKQDPQILDSANNRVVQATLQDVLRKSLVVFSGTRYTMEMTAQCPGILEFWAIGFVLNDTEEQPAIRLIVEVDDRHVKKNGDYHLSVTRTPDAPWVRYQLSIDPKPGVQVCTFIVESDCETTDPNSIGALIGSPVFIPDSKTRYPNVVMVCFDSLRADELGAYGSPLGLSPTIDRLSQKSALFSQAVSSSSWTVPAMKNLLSGQYTFQYQAEADEMNTGTGYRGIPVQQIFADSGYYTIAVVSNPVIKARNDFDHGFDMFDVFPVRMWRENSDKYLETRVQEALELVGNRPVFLYIHVMDPHDPYKPREPYRKMFVSTADDAVRPVITRGESGILNLKPQSSELLPLTELEREYLRSHYRAEIRQADAWLHLLAGQLVRQFGSLDSTVLLVTSDHGEEFGEHGYYQHGMSLYESSVRVPWIISYPAMKLPPIIQTGWVSTIDVPSTLCRLAGIEPEITWDGLGVFPRDADYPVDRTIYSAVRSTDEASIPRMRWRGLYRGDRKMLWNGMEEITGYDLNQAPDEKILFQCKGFEKVTDCSEDLQWSRMGADLEVFSGSVVEKSSQKMGQLLTEQLKELGYVH